MNLPKGYFSLVTAPAVAVGRRNRSRAFEWQPAHGLTLQAHFGISAEYAGIFRFENERKVVTHLVIVSHCAIRCR